MINCSYVIIIIFFTPAHLIIFVNNNSTSQIGNSFWNQI